MNGGADDLDDLREGLREALIREVGFVSHSRAAYRRFQAAMPTLFHDAGMVQANRRGMDPALIGDELVNQLQHAALADLRLYAADVRYARAKERGHFEAAPPKPPRRRPAPKSLRENARRAMVHAQEMERRYLDTATARGHRELLDALQIAADAAEEAGYHHTADRLRRRVRSWETGTSRGSFRPLSGALRDGARAGRR